MGHRITPEDTVYYMLQSKEVWKIMQNMTAVVLHELRRVERQRTSEARDANSE